MTIRTPTVEQSICILLMGAGLAGDAVIVENGTDAGRVWQMAQQAVRKAGLEALNATLHDLERQADPVRRQIDQKLHELSDLLLQHPKVKIDSMGWRDFLHKMSNRE